jgi:hypothetical protein
MIAMRIYSSIGLALLMVLGSTFTIFAETPVVDRFTFARPPAPESTVDPKGRLSVAIDRWSTDTERDRLVADLAQNGPDKLLDALRDAPNAGTMYWPGGTLYSVRYARRITRPDGGIDAVFVVDRPLWMWWESKPASMPYPYSVVQVRLGKDGAGEGRVSHGVPVSSDKALGVVLSDYAKAPAVLTDVRHEHQTT